MTKHKIFRTVLCGILLTVFKSASSTDIEKHVFGTQLFIPQISEGFIPICSTNQDAWLAVQRLMASPGFSHLLTCFAKPEVGRLKMDQVIAVLAYIKDGDEKLDKSEYLEIKNDVKSAASDKSGQFWEKHRERVSGKVGTDKIVKQSAPSYTSIYDSDFGYLVHFKGRVKLPEGHQEAEQFSVNGVIHVKDRVLFINSYSIEVNDIEQKEIIRIMKIWFEKLLDKNR